METKTRYLVGDLKAELRQADGDGADILEGYASIFNNIADIGGYYKEQFAKGAFSRAISEQHDVRALVDHRSELLLGRTKAGTLKIWEDEIGLRVEIKLPKNTNGQNIKESVARGDLTQMSIGFIPLSEEFDRTGETILRTITDVELLDVSVVTYPAYEDTKISLRNAVGSFSEQSDNSVKPFPFIRKAKIELLSRSDERKSNK